MIFIDVILILLQCSKVDLTNVDGKEITQSKFSIWIETSNNNNSHICSTDYCIQEGQFTPEDRANTHLFLSALFIRKNMDETVDPCENFYEFTCGSFMRNSQISSNGKLPDLVFSHQLIVFLH